MTNLRRVIPMCLFAFVFGGVGLHAQASAAPPVRVVVQPGARPLGSRIVQVAPAAVRAPARAYEGVQQYRDWRWFGTGGPARSRQYLSNYAQRFRPSVSRAYAFGSTPGYAHPRVRQWSRR